MHEQTDTRSLPHEELVQLHGSLRKRGSLLIRLDKDMTWLAPHDRGPGRPAMFSDSAIQFCLTIKVLFKLPQRRCQSKWA